MRSKVWHQLRRKGINVAKCTVERLMQAMGLAGIRRGRTTITTVSNPKAPCPLDKVNREFRISRPNARLSAEPMPLHFSGASPLGALRNFLQAFCLPA